jgi:hypothetical protein
MSTKKKAKTKITKKKAAQKTVAKKPAAKPAPPAAPPEPPKRSAVDDILNSRPKDVTPVPIAKPPIQATQTIEAEVVVKPAKVAPPQSAGAEPPDDDDIGSEYAPKDLQDIRVPTGEGQDLSLKASDARDFGLDDESDLDEYDGELYGQEGQESHEDGLESVDDHEGPDAAPDASNEPGEAPAPQPTPTEEPKEEPKPTPEPEAQRFHTVNAADLSAIYSTLIGSNRIIEWAIQRVPGRILGAKNLQILTNRRQANLKAMRSIRHLVK